MKRPLKMDRKSISTRRWNKENAVRVQECVRKWNQNHPGYNYNHCLKKKYGITLEEYEAMRIAQGGGCAVCGNTNKNGKRLHVDHDHGTGQIRGLLCENCNRALGYVHDSTEILRKLKNYLQQHNDKREIRKKGGRDRINSDDENFGRIRGKGDKALLGGRTTRDMKEKLGVPEGRALADFLPTITIKAKDFANEITNFNVKQNELGTAFHIGEEHVKNNKEVRKLLIDRGIIPETLPAAEDVKKVARRLTSEEKKLPKRAKRLEDGLETEPDRG